MIDIIMCTYNSEKTINSCIKSILNQTYPHFNLYIFDDNSSDNTIKEILKFKDKRITVIKSTTNVGTYAGKNFIYKNFSRSPYVALHDSDDISLPIRLESQINYMVKNDVKCLGTAVYEFFEDHTPHTISNYKISKNERINTYPEIIDKTVLPKAFNLLESNYNDYLKLKFCMNGTCMFDSKIIKELGGWDGETRIAADTDIFLRILSKYEIHNLKDPLYKRRFHKKSLTASSDYGIKSAIRKKYALNSLKVIKNSINNNLTIRNYHYPKLEYKVYQCAE